MRRRSARRPERPFVFTALAALSRSASKLALSAALRPSYSALQDLSPVYQ